ncbi:MAG TPA: D-Ala-D-Ala carboxypeptidase family metallohydrolase [Polyangiaceae bacterium]
MESIALTRCDGRPAPLATLELSIVARPESAPKPAGPVIAAALAHRTDPGPDVKLVGEGLVTRLQTVADHFDAAKVIIVSGYRPNSTGSFHQMAEALDLHFDGIPNEALVAFCRTLPDTGCGYYPNSSFVHLDVRPAHTGHVYWIDASGPGEAARYVSTWPMIEHEPAPCAEGARRDAWCAHIVRPDQLVAEPALAIVPDSAGDPFTP